ncbi:MAG: hypothetical protein ABWX85_11845 [Arthrobacter sp.]
MSDDRVPGGAVAELAAASVLPVHALAAPSHCGMPMEWKAPELAAATVYSLAPVNAAAELPPLWRCACGFQLDGIAHTPGVLAELSR